MLLILIPSAFLLSSLPLLSNAGRSHPARFVSGPNTHQRLATRATNLQIFTGALGDILPPAVTYDESLSRPYLVGSRQELDLITALGVSCDDQHSLCAHAANAGGDWTVGECDKQNEECKASISSDNAPVATPSRAATSDSAQIIATSTIATTASAVAAVSSATFISSSVEDVFSSIAAEDPLSSAVVSQTPIAVVPTTSSAAAPSPIQPSSSSRAVIVSPSVIQEVVVPSSSRAPKSSSPTSEVAAPATKASTTTSKASVPASTSAFRSSYTGLKKGDGTFYGDSSSGNACLLPERSDNMFAAWPGATWNTAEHCGSCLRVTGPLGSVNVQVINECPECLEGSLDLSTSAFTKIATQSDGRVPISWEFISCFEAGLEKPSTESFAWKSGSSAYWAGIQARHTDGNVAKLAIKINGVYTDIPRLNYNYHVQSSGFGSGPFDVRVTLDNGDVSEYNNIALNSVIGDA